MHFRDLLAARELGPSVQGQEIIRLEKTCKPVLWPRWCPVDIALWIVTTSIIILLLWKIHRSYRVNHNSDEQRRQLSPNATHRDKKSLETGSTILDPYLVVYSLEDSLVAKDPSFQSVSIPQPVLEKSSSRQLTGLGITFGSQSLSATLNDLSSRSHSLTTTATSTTSHSGSRPIVAFDGEKDDHATSKIPVHNNPFLI